MAQLAEMRPFVMQIRAPRDAALKVGEAGGERIAIRVQFEPLWDLVVMDVRKDTPVEVVARAMLDYFGESAALASFVVKVRGWQVKDLAVTLADADVRDGTVVHVAHRYRRPVR